MSLETCASNMMSISLTVLELLAFNAQQFWSHTALAKPPFCLEIRVLNLKSIALTGLKLLAFNAPNCLINQFATHTQMHRLTI